jgi:hypothetical protein
MIDPKDTPDFTNAAYKRMSPAWSLLGDVLAGQDKIRASRDTYLPKESAELAEDYQNRLNRSLFFEDYRDCVVNLTGMVFRKSPTLVNDVPQLLLDLAENIDNAGTHLDVFLQRLFEDGFYGHSFVVVDRPASDPNVKTAADEIATGARSYWCLRQAKDAYNWRAETVNGRTILTQITFKECVIIPDGAFGEKEVTRYRVYRLNDSGNAEWQLWEEKDVPGETKKQVEMIDDGPILTKRSQPLKRLPIAVHYGEHEGFLESRPPLKGIADINLAYYQKYSDLSNIEHHTCAVTLVIESDPSETNDKTLGGNRVLYVGMGQKAYFLEVSGDSIPALERDLEMLDKRLVAKGLDFLAGDEHRVPSTATEALLSYTQRTSKLAKMVRSIIDCTEEALGITAEMEGLDEGGSITLGVDENSLTLTPEEVDKYSLMNERGQLSLKTLWAILDRADLLPDDFDPDEEEAAVKQAALEQMELNAKQFDSGEQSTP